MPSITPDTENELTLDDLFALAKKHIREMKADEAKKSKEPRRAEAPRPHSRVYAPENWIDGEVVALVSESTGEFLGKFISQSHRTDSAASRYVSAPADAPAKRTLVIRGTWGRPLLPPPPPSARSLFTVRTLALVAFRDISSLPTHLTLEVEANRDVEGLVSAKLLETQLFSDNGSIFSLGTGTNILPAMTAESKADLRRSIFHGN